MRLKGEIIKVNSLSELQRDRMFELMSIYFDGVNRTIFDEDLHEKKWVILLHNYITGEIEGFSTQMLLEQIIDGMDIKAVFSGDTIIHKEYWGSFELVRIWGRFIFSLIQKYRTVKLYWFLISMGYKTYRFLPIFFKEFYPRYDKPIPPFEKKLLDIFGNMKYPQEYNAKLGIIRPVKTKVYLKPGVADINSHLLNNPHINFFVMKNPLYYKGDELVCIAELKKENLKPIGNKIMNQSTSLLPII